MKTLEGQLQFTSKNVKEAHTRIDELEEMRPTSSMKSPKENVSQEQIELPGMEEEVKVFVDEETLEKALAQSNALVKQEIEIVMKRKLATKVDNESLNDLEDNYSMNMDNLVKMVTKKYMERTDIRRIMRNMDR